MKSFLSIVADDLYRRCGSDLSRTAIIFPNKRAGLFFNEALTRTVADDTPVWSPVYLTISELFRSMSPYRQCDEIEAVCQLHRLYCEHTRQSESIDNFYHWGEMLLRDFDDADKNMVDARRLFANLNDLKSIGQTGDFLSPEQSEALRHFFHHFSPQRQTELKRRFLQVWEAMGDIYRHFREQLARQGEAYEGMLQRHAVENFDSGKLHYQRYLFVGFNVLNRVEEELFKRVADQRETLFYWDYDLFYTEPTYHEAGRFLRRNMAQFPNSLPTGDYDNLRRPKQVRFISAPTENSQARYLQQWLAQHPADKGADNAVVLCNEGLLQPVLHSIPPQEGRRLNITMGFPFVQTPLYGYLQALTKLQTEGYDERRGSFGYRHVCSLLAHPYLRRALPRAAAIGDRLAAGGRFFPTLAELQSDHEGALLFAPQKSPAQLLDYLRRMLMLAVESRRDDDMEQSENILFSEAAYRAVTVLNRFATLVESGKLQVSRTTLCSLLGRVWSSTAIPFHGEPIEGLQIMGLLETRNLDFKNVVMLSVNEGNLPQGGGEASFIPYNLRRAFGMTTIENRDSIYCYYFYRLLQRAQSVTLLYSNASDKTNSRECSRFMLQFQVELPHPIEYFYLNSRQKPTPSQPLSIEKSPHVMECLRQRFYFTGEKRNMLSPTAINAYLDCPLKFFLRYLARLKPAEEASSQIDSGLFGSIFHQAAQQIYEGLAAESQGGSITAGQIEALLKEKKQIERCIDESFNQNLFHLRQGEGQPPYNGEQLINREVIKSYLLRLLAIDKEYAPFRFVAAEYPIVFLMQAGDETAGGTTPVAIGGTIDRLDAKGDTLHIVDYKTGGRDKNVNELQDIFVPGEKRASYFLQTFLYSAALLHSPLPGYEAMKVSPGLLYIHRAAGTQRDDSTLTVAKQPVSDFSLYCSEFMERLQTVIDEIYDARVPFAPTRFAALCEKCDYKDFCHR